ncbi:hypothetical protein TAMYLO_180074 [Tenacibaculum amylolyticum]
MEILFENKKKAIRLNTILENIFINIPVSVLFFILFKSLLTWSKT